MRIDGLGKLAYASLASGLLVAGCAGEPAMEPIEYSTGDRIALSKITVTVERTEHVRTTSTDSRRLQSNLAGPGERAIAVFVRWSGLEDLSQTERGFFIRSFLENRLSVVDDAGDRYQTVDVLEASQYLEQIGGSGSTIVAVFHLHEDSRKLVLLIEHPDPPEGQSPLVAVSLEE